MTAVVKNIISSLVFAFQFNNKFLVATLHELLKQKNVKGSASKANKDCQILFFDVHVVHRTPKVSFPQRITQDDGEQVARSLHSNVQLLYSVIKTIDHFINGGYFSILLSVFKSAWLASCGLKYSFEFFIQRRDQTGKFEYTQKNTKIAAIYERYCSLPFASSLPFSHLKVPKLNLILRLKNILI